MHKMVVDLLIIFCRAKAVDIRKCLLQIKINTNLAEIVVADPAYPITPLLRPAAFVPIQAMSKTDCCFLWIQFTTYFYFFLL